MKSQLGKLRRRFSEVNAIDFFGANGRMIVEGLLSEIDTRLVDANASKWMPALTGSKSASGNEMDSIKMPIGMWR